MNSAATAKRPKCSGDVRIWFGQRSSHAAGPGSEQTPHETPALPGAKQKRNLLVARRADHKHEEHRAASLRKFALRTGTVSLPGERIIDARRLGGTA